MSWDYTYEQMLERAYKRLPEASQEAARFELPELHGLQRGNQTIISNLRQVSDQLRRPFEHLLKFLLRELATTGDEKGGEVIFMGKFKGDFLNEKLKKYAGEFVLCHQCGKPDTHLEKADAATLLICEACGAKDSVRTLK